MYPNDFLNHVTGGGIDGGPRGPAFMAIETLSATINTDRSGCCRERCD